MSPRAWRNGLLASAVLWALIFGLVFGCRAAAAPSLADPNPYLERHGLHAVLVPFAETTEPIHGRSGDVIPGRYRAAGVLVDAELQPIDKLHITLHEWLHSFGEDEGLTEAMTLHLLPGYARWLLGRPLRRATIAAERSAPIYSEAFRWLRAASKATGTPRWSRANREWLIARLQDSLDECVAVLA